MPSIDVAVALPFALGAGVQLALAVLVYASAARDAKHVWLALLLGFNGAWDLAEGLSFAVRDPRDTVALGHAWIYAWFGANAALVLFLGHYPQHSRWARSRIAAPLVVGTFAVAGLSYALDHRLFGAIDGQGLPIPTGPLGLALLAWHPLLALGAWIAFLNARRRPAAQREASPFLVAAALSVYPIGFFARTLRFDGENLRAPVGLEPGEMAIFAVVKLAGLVAALAAAALVVALVATLLRTPRWGRGLAGSVCVGLAAMFAASALGYAGIGSILFAGLLAYALLRHRLLGVDVKVRWTLSKSTVAAAFVAVFFLASEGAQLVFGAENQWMGLAAAGALVFAMAPLQRAAERLAEKVVPIASASEPVFSARGPSAAAHLEAAYREAVRAAARDGILTRREERHLSALADHLGIGARRALDLREEVERELTAGGGA